MMGVWFADIEACRGDSTVFSQPVAIKPVGPAWLATQETRMSVLVNNIGAEDHPDVSCCPVTFVPRGIIVTDDGKFNTMTTYEEAVRSFDNDLQNEERPNEFVINNALGFAAASLIYLHANKITHGDFQVKNTASDGVSGRIIDLTTAKQRNTINDSNMPSFYGDFEKYLYSVHRSRELNKISRETILEHFIEPVIDCLPDLYPSEFLHSHAANAYTLVDDLFK